MPTAMPPLLLKGLVNDSPSIWCSLLMSPNWPAISSECTHDQRRIKPNLTTRFANFSWKWTHAGTKSVWHGLLQKKLDLHDLFLAQVRGFTIGWVEAFSWEFAASDMPKAHLTEQEVEDAINAVQKQQKESLQCMAFLKEQHEKWQDSVEQLLAKIRPDHIEVVCALPKPDTAHTTPVTTVTESHPLGTTEGLPMKSAVPREIPAISQDAMGAFQFLEKGPLKKVVDDILSDMEARHMSTKELTGCGLFRHMLARIVDSKLFEWAAGCIILLNMITIGIEAELSLRSGNHDEIFSDMERGFLVFYTVELVVRLIAGGGAVFCNLWWILDFILVIVGLASLVIAPLLTTWKIIRGLRLLRLVRAFRMIRYFKVMWRLVYGLLKAGGTMLSTTALMILTLFIAGCIALEIITQDQELKNDPVTGPIVEVHFASLPTSMLTLIQFVSLDSTADMFFPLMQVKPALVFFFLPIGIVISIGLMNLVTAVLVEKALAAAAEEAEIARIQVKNKVKGALPALLEIFMDLDQDGSGYITREEIQHVPLDILPSGILENISIPSMADLFELLDVDRTGSLTQEEFVSGLLNLVLLDVPIWTIQSLRLLGSLKDVTEKIQQDIKRLSTSEGIESRLWVTREMEPRWRNVNWRGEIPKFAQQKFAQRLLLVGSTPLNRVFRQCGCWRYRMKAPSPSQLWTQFHPVWRSLTGWGPCWPQQVLLN